VSVRKVGIEEELLLVDPETRRVTPVSGATVEANEREEEVGGELFQHQVETSTPPVTDADDIERHLRTGRRAVGEAAAAEVEPQEDIHASAAYRRALTGTMAERALKAAVAR